MAVIVRQNIVSPTSENIQKIQESEKELIAVMGLETFREMGLDNSVSLCKGIVSYVSKYANDEQKVQIKALFPDDKGLDSIAQACLKVREIINLNVLPDSKEGKDCVDKFEETILEMFEEPLKDSREITCKMAVERQDLEMLKRLKKLNRGWSQDLEKVAENEFNRLSGYAATAETPEKKIYWQERASKAMAVWKWIVAEFKQETAS